MEQEETPHHHGGIWNYFQGATIHNLVINGNMSRSGTESYSAATTTENTRHHYTDEQVATALANIVGRGKAIDSKQKWAGAVWLLRWQCNYPVNARQACERIMSLPFPRKLEYSCDYNNIRPLTTLSFLNENPNTLENVRYSKNDEQAFLQLRGVVTALKDELEKQRPVEQLS